MASGLFGKEASDLCSSMSTKYSGYFSALEAINDYSHEVLSKLKPGAGPRYLFSSCLFLRGLQSAQSAALLAKYCLHSDVAVLLRTQLEALVLLTNVCRVEDFLAEYVGSAPASATKVFPRLMRHATFIPDEMRRQQTSEAIEKLRKENLSRGAKLLPPLEQLAERVGLLEYYDFIYRFVSRYAHVSAESLDDFIILAEDGPREVVYGLSESEIPLFLYTVGLLSTFALVEVDHVHQFGGAREIESHMESIMSLQPE